MDDKNFGTKSVIYATRSGARKRTVPVARRLVVSVRFRPTTLATIARYLTSLGQIPRNMSEITQLALESMETMIEARDSALSFTIESDAISYLQQAGILQDSLSRRNSHLLANNLELDDLEESKKFDKQHQEALRYLKEALKEDSIEQDYSPENLKATLLSKPEDLVDENSKE